MTTLTRLEDLLLHSREEAKGIILQLRAARKQLGKVRISGEILLG